MTWKRLLSGMNKNVSSNFSRWFLSLRTKRTGPQLSSNFNGNNLQWLKKIYKKLTTVSIEIQKTLFSEILLLILLIIKTNVFSCRVSNFDMLIKILFDITRKITQKTAKRFFARMNSDVVLNVGRSGHNFWTIRTGPSCIS